MLDGEILLEVDAALPRTPSVSRAARAAARISVHVALLELIWAFVYSWMVRYEETVQKAQLYGDEVGSTTSHNSGLVTRAEALWAWARNLRSGYTIWPKDLPSPIAQADEFETYYVEKANFVFERATACIDPAVSAQVKLLRRTRPSRSRPRSMIWTTWRSPARRRISLAFFWNDSKATVMLCSRARTGELSRVDTIMRPLCGSEIVAPSGSLGSI